MIQKNTQSRTSVQSIVHRPILFSGPMVQAILAGRKTQTRRVIKGKGTWSVEEADDFSNRKWPGYEDEYGTWTDMECPYGYPTDHLWVRETHYVESAGNQDGVGRFVLYRATDKDAPVSKWTPSIHMPRWASRITLEITDVRVERLKQITDDDIAAEGIESLGSLPGTGGPSAGQFGGKYSTLRQLFSGLWVEINGPGSWDADPWVWVVSFKVV